MTMTEQFTDAQGNPVEIENHPVRVRRTDYAPGERPIRPAHYRLDFTETERSGKCIDCGGGIAILHRYYTERPSGKLVSSRVRTACDCTPEFDQYAEQ